ILALGEKMDFVPVCMGDVRSHGIIGESLKRGKPVSGHIYGREFVAAYAASGVTDTHEAIDRDIADDFLEAGIWVFLRGGPPTTPWHSLPEAIKAVTELGASTKRVCVCTDDRDADDLFEFGLDWVTRQAIVAGLSPLQAWSMGSLHPATRFGMDGELGALGHGRRADITLLGDDLTVINTWYGGALMVEDRKVTPLLDKQLSEGRYLYPKQAYETVRYEDELDLLPEIPDVKSLVSIVRTELPGIVTLSKSAQFEPEVQSWDDFMDANDLVYLSVVERYGKTGGIGHGLLQNFGLTDGAVGSSVGHDAHNVVIAGESAEDMKIVARRIKELRGGVVVVKSGKIIAEVPLPIAGLLSDERGTEVAAQTTALKEAWSSVGCSLPYMGFNLLPLSVIPEIRLTDKGLVLVPEMKVKNLFSAL
ncbi:MAG: amidohydrolase family protein, partial [Opitutales bacterium]|nr:amidohydrolase family protein [Opitutales bacterium]